MVVQIETIAGTLAKEFISSDTAETVLKYVKEVVGDKNQFLYFNKKQIKKSESIGSICKDTVCNLVALDPRSKEERDRFL